MKPCTLGKRHRWAFRHDVITTYMNGRIGRVSKRGLYRCECGAEKLGNPAGGGQ